MRVVVVVVLVVVAAVVVEVEVVGIASRELIPAACVRLHDCVGCMENANDVFHEILSANRARNKKERGSSDLFLFFISMQQRWQMWGSTCAANECYTRLLY